MLKLSKKQYKALLADFVTNPLDQSLKIYIDFENEFLYFLNPETDLVWYAEGSFTQLRKNLGWTVLPKAMLKQANKVILQDKHFIVLEPEESFLNDDKSVPKPLLSMFDGISSGQLTQDEETPKQAVCALIVKRTSTGLKFLGVSRKDDPTDFGLPGGKLEVGESIFVALEREVLEETGYTIQDVVLELYSKTDASGYEVTTFLAKIDNDVSYVQPAPEETGLVKWVTAEELVKGSFGKYNRDLLESLHYYAKPTPTY